MKIQKVYIKKLKNLVDFNIEIDQSKPYTILLGKNATGKSNFLEAIIQIFKYLDLERNHPDKEFEYRIHYSCRDYDIEISNEKGRYNFTVNSEHLKSSKDFFSKKDIYLPRHIFTYYSGTSNKLKDNFTEHLKKYYLTIIDPKAIILDISEIRRLFYAENIHSNFVLLAFYSFLETEAQSKNFLQEVLEIEDFQSALFVLKKPVWYKAKKDSKFWGATGIVKEFLESLFEYCLAPISNSELIEVSYKNNIKQDRLYLYLSNKAKLQKLAESWVDRIPFFNALESTYISDLVEDIRIRVKKVNVKKEISYRDLSEGEQQLLAVLGLLKFTQDEESLILLDEPDTHLNPLWKWKYLEFLQGIIGTANNKTQIFITTHDPLIIGSLEKEQIRIFKHSKKNKPVSSEPDIDPKGLGVEGILTSELFGLPTTLDKVTQTKLNRMRHLTALDSTGKKLSDLENSELKDLKKELSEIGFYDTTNDQLYNKFLQELATNELFQKVEFTEKEKKELNDISTKILNNLVQELKEEHK